MRTPTADHPSDNTVKPNALNTETKDFNAEFETTRRLNLNPPWRHLNPEYVIQMTIVVLIHL